MIYTNKSLVIIDHKYSIINHKTQECIQSLIKHWVSYIEHQCWQMFINCKTILNKYESLLTTEILTVTCGVQNHKVITFGTWLLML